MGGISSTSNLTAIANFSVLVSVFSMTGTMIIGRNTREWKAWMTIPYGILLYIVLVVVGGNIRNPLDLYTGQALTDANTYFFIVWPILSLFFSIMGWAWCRVLDSGDLWPLGARVPNPISSSRTVVNVDENGGLSIKEEDTRPGKTLPQVMPSWAHLLVTFLFFAVIAASQGVYDYYITIAGDDWIAFVVRLGTGVVFSILYLIYCVVWTDIYVFGYSKSNLKSLEVDSDTKKNIASETRQRVIWTIVPIGAFDFLGVLAIGGTRLLTPNVNNNFYAMLGYFLALLILLVIVWFVMKKMNPLASLKSKRIKVNDSDPYYQDVASHTPLYTNATKRGGLGSFFIEQ